MKTAFIGCGNMGEAFLKPFASSFGKKNILIFEKDKNKINSFKKKGIKCYNTLNKNINSAEIIILAFKPQDAENVFNELKKCDLKNKIFVSMLAGKKTSYFEKKIKGIKIIRLMPNLPMTAGRGVCGFYKGKNASSADLNLIKRVLNKICLCVVMEKESGMDKITALSGSGPAYVCYFMEALTDAAAKMNFPAGQRENIIFSIFKGTLDLMEKEKISPRLLRKKVTSEKGTTEAALKTFEKLKLKYIINEGVKNAEKRSRELSKK